MCGGKSTVNKLSSEMRIKNSRNLVGRQDGRAVDLQIFLGLCILVRWKTQHRAEIYLPFLRSFS